MLIELTGWHHQRAGNRKRKEQCHKTAERGGPRQRYTRGLCKERTASPEGWESEEAVLIVGAGYRRELHHRGGGGPGKEETAR